jgi:DNA polymerase elongation subunit (family B)
MKGWLLGADPVRGRPEVRLWIKTDAGIRCIRKEFRPVWYVRARNGDYRDLRQKLREIEDCSFEMTKLRLFAGGDRQRRIMKVTMDTCSSSIPRVDALETFLGIERYDFYNVDIDAARQYMVAHGLFPFARVEIFGNRIEPRDNPYSLHYPIPDLRAVKLSVKARTDEAFPTLSDPIDHVVLEEKRLVNRGGDTVGRVGDGGGSGGKGDRKRDGDGAGNGNGRVTGTVKGWEGGTPRNGEAHRVGVGGDDGGESVMNVMMTGRGAGGQGGVTTDINTSNRMEFRKSVRGGVEDGRGKPAPKTGVSMEFEDSLDGAGVVRRKVLRGDERQILSRLQWEVRNTDLILTSGGDSFDLPYLHARAVKNEMVFTLGREGHRIGGKRGSYFSYGRILYRPDFWLLKGRFHLDMTNAFLYAEGGIEGCIDLTRMSCIAFQTLARVSPGTVINAMEVHWALRNGYPIPFRKNIPESPKTLKQLVKADRGGHIFNPVVGLHEEVVEMDFFSMFPMIMVRYNISPETLNCECCGPEERIQVPGLTYYFCGKRTGMIPQVIWPVLQRRMQLKKLTRHKDDGYAKRSNALKWLLVTSFGYTGYRNARFGQIECHESINAVDRELIVRSSELAQQYGFEVLHGIVDSLWLKSPLTAEQGLLERTEGLRSRIEEEVNIPLKLEGVFDWIVFLPNRTTGVGALNRYYGKYTTGEVKVRGIELRMHDTPDYFRRLQTAMLDVLKVATNREEFIALVPEAVRVLVEYAVELLGWGVDPWELVFHKRTSRDLEEYSVFNEQVAALKQLETHGVKKNAGQGVDYVILDRSSKDPSGKVRVRELMRGDEKYDRKVYYRYLLRCGESLLMPLGYGKEELDRSVKTRTWGF